MSLQRSPTRYAIHRLATPIRRSIRRRPSPRSGSAVLRAATAPGCSAAAWVLVPGRRGGWPEVLVRSAPGAGSRHLWIHLSSRRRASSRRSAPAEAYSNEMRR
jgi:hypothetical protein